MQASLNNITIQLIQGDITTLAVRALVHSATPDLNMRTSDLGEALLEKGGDSIQQEAFATIYIEEGDAILTSGGNLPASYVIHAVCPRMGSGSERGKLANAIWNSLKIAAEHPDITSIAFPALATGRAGGFPVEACARVMAQKIVDFTFEDTGNLQIITVCLKLDATFAIFAEAFKNEIDAALDEAEMS